MQSFYWKAQKGGSFIAGGKYRYFYRKSEEQEGDFIFSFVHNSH